MCAAVANPVTRLTFLWLALRSTITLLKLSPESLKPGKKKREKKFHFPELLQFLSPLIYCRAQKHHVYTLYSSKVV